MKKKGNWKLVVGILCLLGAMSAFTNGGGGFASLVIGALLIGWWYLSNKEAEARAKEAEAKQLEEIDEMGDEFETIEEFKVVGVTFDNDDGSSRQENLKRIVDNDGTADATFKEYEFNGKPAIAVYADGYCIGSIASGSINRVRKLIAKGMSATVHADKFKNEEGKTIYYANIMF